MKIYAGFDCCGSRTRCMLVSESGAMLGCGEGSGCEVILSICSLGDILLCMMLFEYASVDADELKERLYRETGKKAVICCYSGGYEGYLPSGRPLDKEAVMRI